MYRPHDIHMTNEESRTRPLTELFWSDEIARMYPRDMTNVTNRVSMEDIVGPIEHHEDEERRKATTWSQIFCKVSGL